MSLSRIDRILALADQIDAARQAFRQAQSSCRETAEAAKAHLHSLLDQMRAIHPAYFD